MTRYIILRDPLHNVAWDLASHLYTRGDLEMPSAVVMNRLMPRGPYTSSVVLGPDSGSRPLPGQESKTVEVCKRQ